MLIDWHSHHTPPELIARFEQITGAAPRPDPYDSADFDQRLAALDSVGIDLQLVSQGAGVNADRLPREHVMEAVRLSNDVVADRVAAHGDRFAGTIVVSFQDVPGSVAEIDRMAERGFRAVFMYAKPEVLGSAAVEPLFAKIAERRLPIFLHGGGGGGGPQVGLDLLEDGGQGVTVSAHADGAVADFVVRTIAAGLFDRYPGLQFVIRSSGGSVPLLLGKLYWKHKGAGGDKSERTYREILLDHFLVDCASASPRTLQFLLDTMGEERVVFGSDYCGGLGQISKALPVLDDQSDPSGTRAILERNSRRLLGI